MDPGDGAGGEVSPTLEVLAGGHTVFSSDGSWLHPLLELGAFLTSGPRPRGELVAVDKVVGKAAAMIMVHLGIQRVHAGIMSRLAVTFLESRGIPFTYDELVDRVLCRTEELLAEIEDPAEAFRIIKRRAEGAA